MVVDATLTVWLRGEDVLGLLSTSPAYEAVIEWIPVASDAMERRAVSAASVAVPSDVDPSKNSTLPVGVFPTAVSCVTVAINMTVSPNTDGLEADTSAVDVPTGGAAFAKAGNRPTPIARRIEM